MCFFGSTRVVRSIQDKPVVKGRLQGLWLRNGLVVLIHQPLLSHDPQGFVDRVQVRPGSLVRVPVVVGPGKVLSVVARKVHVVEGVVSWAVDELFQPVSSDHVTVMNEDGPDLDQSKEHHIQVLLHGANEDENTVNWLANKLD